MWPLSRRRFTEPEAEQQRGVQLESQRISTCVKCSCDRCARRRYPTKSQYCYGPRKPILDSDPFAFEFVAFEKVPKSAITVHSSPRNVQGAHRSLDIILSGCAGQEICTHSCSFLRMMILSSNREMRASII